MLDKTLVLCADFRATGKVFWGLVPQKKTTLKGDILELESYNNLANLASAQFFSLSKITPP